MYKSFLLLIFSHFISSKLFNTQEDLGLDIMDNGLINKSQLIELKQANLKPKKKNNKTDLKPEKKSNKNELKPKKKNKKTDLKPEKKSNKNELKPEKKNNKNELKPEKKNKKTDLKPEKKNKKNELKPEKKNKKNELKPEKKSQLLDLSELFNSNTNETYLKENEHNQANDTAALIEENNNDFEI